MIRPTLFIIAMMSSMMVCAELPLFYGSAQFGVSRIKVSGGYTFNDYNDSSGATEFGWNLGSRFSNNIILEVSYIESDGHSFAGAGDSYDLKQKHVLIGYSFRLGSGLRVTPKVGTTEWRIKGREGVFLNPGEEDESDNNGSDVVYAIELNNEAFTKKFFRVLPAYSVGLHCSWTNTDFGDYFSARLGATFQY